MKTILSLCTRYKKWWYGFGLPAPCSKRWVAASLHSLMDGKRLLTPSCPWAFLSLHWQWSAASSHDKECQSDGNATSVTAAPHPEQKVKINLRFLALWVTNILQVSEGSVAWLWTNTIPYGILRMRKEEAAREKLKYSMREWLECRCLIYLTLLPSRILEFGADAIGCCPCPIHTSCWFTFHVLWEAPCPAAKGKSWIV